MYFNAFTFKSIVFACAIIGVCQSAAWIGLTVCAILKFRCVLRTPQYDTDHVIVTTIVKLYFEGDECKVEGYPPGYRGIAEVNHAKPVEIFSWMIAFLIVSLLQLLVSISLYNRKVGESARTVLKQWCLVTIVVSAMDTVLAGTFFRDYIELRDYFDKHLMRDEDGIAAAPAAMFIIAARGLALWIVNAGFLLYFSIFLTCTPGEAELDGNLGERDTVAAIGVDNRAFKISSESLVRREREGRDLASYDATQEMTFYPMKEQQRRFSVSSFEAITRFGEEEIAGIETDNKLETKKETSRFECNCHKWADNRDGALQRQWRSNYHSHGCSALKSELEQKLATIRSSEERVLSKSREFTDFSHDLRNFKPGGGRGGLNKPKSISQGGGIPEAPSIPAAVVCNTHGFY